MKGFIGAVALLALLHGTSSAIMTSALYLTTVYQEGMDWRHEVHVLQGDSEDAGDLMVNSWDRPADAYAPAVSGGTVRIAPGIASDGAEYTTDGIATGTTYAYGSAYPGNLSGSAAMDAATDGVRNYAFGAGETSQSKVYRWNADWSSPTELLDLTSLDLQYPTAITYGGNSNLWVSGIRDAGQPYEATEYRVFNISMDTGNILGTFEVDYYSHFLAMDYADGTLWTQDIYTKTLYQYNTSGGELSYVTSSFLYTGGEFEYGVVPEPAALLLVASVLAAGALLGWRRRRGAGR